MGSVFVPAPEQPGETAFAKAAFRAYLMLPKPRRAMDLVGVTLPDAARPINASTMNLWRTKYRWLERARRYDEAVLAAEEQARIEARRTVALEREEARLRDAELLRASARKVIVYPDDHKTRAGQPKTITAKNARVAEIAGQYIKEAAAIERADLGGEEQQAPPTVINVLTPEAMDEVIRQVEALQQKTMPHRMRSLPGQPVLDAELIDDDDTGDEPDDGLTDVERRVHDKIGQHERGEEAI